MVNMWLICGEYMVNIYIYSSWWLCVIPWVCMGHADTPSFWETSMWSIETHREVGPKMCEKKQRQWESNGNIIGMENTFGRTWIFHPCFFFAFWQRELLCLVRAKQPWMATFARTRSHFRGHPEVSSLQMCWDDRWMVLSRWHIVYIYIYIPNISHMSHDKLPNHTL